MAAKSSAHRPVCYSVAMSLDGFIAGPQGEADWIVMDPEIDFGAMFARFDTLLIGRKTFIDLREKYGEGGNSPDVQSVVFSRTLQPSDYPDVTIVRDAEPFVAELKAKPGKDIWLFGGGELFHTLLAARLVDSLDVAVVPVLLGGGTALLPAPSDRAKLSLKGHRVYAKSGIVRLEYDVKYPR